MKKISTTDLVTWELKSYLDGVLSCCDLDDGAMGRYVTGKALELLKRLPESERAYALDKVLAKPDFNCINSIPYNQEGNEFFLAPTEFEIDITDIELETPEDFYLQKTGDCKLAYYSVHYGAFIALDIDRLNQYVTDYLSENE